VSFRDKAQDIHTAKGTAKMQRGDLGGWRHIASSGSGALLHALSGLYTTIYEMAMGEVFFQWR
jgi:hypothetical protein